MSCGQRQSETEREEIQNRRGHRWDGLCRKSAFSPYRCDQSRGRVTALGTTEVLDIDLDSVSQSDMNIDVFDRTETGSVMSKLIVDTTLFDVMEKSARWARDSFWKSGSLSLTLKIVLVRVSFTFVSLEVYDAIDTVQSERIGCTGQRCSLRVYARGCCRMQCGGCLAYDADLRTATDDRRTTNPAYWCAPASALIGSITGSLGPLSGAQSPRSGRTRDGGDNHV